MPTLLGQATSLGTTEEDRYRFEEDLGRRCVLVWCKDKYLGRVPHESIAFIVDDAPPAKKKQPAKKADEPARLEEPGPAT